MKALKMTESDYHPLAVVRLTKRGDKDALYAADHKLKDALKKYDNGNSTVSTSDQDREITIFVGKNSNISMQYLTQLVTKHLTHLPLELEMYKPKPAKKPAETPKQPTLEKSVESLFDEMHTQLEESQTKNKQLTEEMQSQRSAYQRAEATYQQTITDLETKLQSTSGATQTSGMDRESSLQLLFNESNLKILTQIYDLLEETFSMDEMKTAMGKIPGITTIEQSRAYLIAHLEETDLYKRLDEDHQSAQELIAQHDALLKKQSRVAATIDVKGAQEAISLYNQANQIVQYRDIILAQLPKVQEPLETIVVEKVTFHKARTFSFIEDVPESIAHRYEAIVLAAEREGVLVDNDPKTYAKKVKGDEPFRFLVPAAIMNALGQKNEYKVSDLKKKIESSDIPELKGIDKNVASTLINTTVLRMVEAGYVEISPRGLYTVSKDYILK